MVEDYNIICNYYKSVYYEIMGQLYILDINM